METYLIDSHLEFSIEGQYLKITITGRIADKPWVKEGQIVIRKILPLSLTFDHRVTDGADAATFLSKVMRYLEDPGLLFIESA